MLKPLGFSNSSQILVMSAIMVSLISWKLSKIKIKKPVSGKSLNTKMISLGDS